MKKNLTRVITSILAFVMVLTMGLTGSTVTAEAATKVGFYSGNPKVITYSTTDNYSSYYTYLYIDGVSKKSDIKSLKSSNKNIKVEATTYGSIKVTFRDKTASTTISCKAKGKKISTTLKIKKYSNPCKTIKLGSTNFTSKFKNNWDYKQKKTFKNQKLNVQMNKNWKITSIVVSNSSGYTRYTVNSSKFNKKVSLKGSYSYIDINCYNSKTKCYETLTLWRVN